MGGIWHRVELRSGEPVCRASGVPIRAVLEPLEVGDSPARVAASMGLGPADVAAALAHAGLGEEGSEGLQLVQRPPSRPRLAAALEEAAWAELLPDASRPARLALAAALLQVHDFWYASHAAAQEADDRGERASSAYWHGIGHRREPDSANASYWFRRVGRHPIMTRLAEEARALIQASGDPAVADRLTLRGTWNSSAFIDLCNDGRPPAGILSLARKLQRLEMVLLMDATAAAAGLA